MEDQNTKITKIVITVGPCAGKSTAMSWVQKAFTEKGYRVLFIHEDFLKFLPILDNKAIDNPEKILYDISRGGDVNE